MAVLSSQWDVTIINCNIFDIDIGEINIVLFEERHPNDGIKMGKREDVE